MNSREQQRDIQEVAETFIDLLPFTEGGGIAERVSPRPVDELRQLYLFRVSGIAVPGSEQDIFRYAERRFRGVLSAAHCMGWSVATVISGSAKGMQIHLGFIAHGDKHDSQPRKVFERILKGIIYPR
ncbi:MAG: hypothetical protein OXG16_09095 [Rhodospirillales bacterium]|nr:hypothetical protein [Rhodospirillales bacterium]